METKYVYRESAIQNRARTEKNWQQLNNLIQDISKQIGVAPRFNVPIESGNVGFFFGADYV